MAVDGLEWFDRQKQRGTMRAPTTAKEDVMAMLRRLPDNVSIQRIEYHVSVMAGIQEAIADIEAGRTVTQADVERLMEEWKNDDE